MQNDEIRRHFVKLKIRTLLDLALLVPTGYDDTTLSNTLEAGKTHTFEATVQEAGYYNGKFRVVFYLPRFRIKLFSLFFKATAYHLKRFTPGASLIIQGRLENFRGMWQMPQPKTLSQADRIIPKYKTPLKTDILRKLFKTLLTVENLINEGLTPQEAQTIRRIHFPDTLKGVFENGAFVKEVREKLKFVEAYNHLRKFAKKRIDFPAIASLRGDITPFIQRLPFRLSEEQQRVIKEVRADLARSDKAAKRLVIGDVGSGKTMVILAAAMTALPHRSILMAPTSLLAMQLYEEACKHLPPEVKKALVMQGNEQGDVQEADFIIGTHALLYKEKLPKAALIMVDEQHRFGANQRHMLEKMLTDNTRRPHYLQFSATPIPRTQAMLQSALIDVSLITKPPFKKRIVTKIIRKENFGTLLAHIRSETDKGNQALVIYPLVEESDNIPYQSLEEGRAFWEERFDGVFVTHGKDKEKEEVLLRFRNEGKILLATTVVEVGISLPRLTLIVIVGAERLGLATLHQLRGRVGRHGQESWCYLFTKQTQAQRLEAFCKTQDGFEIAKLDLKFRNSGDILDGTIQSGQKFRWLDPAEDEAIVEMAKRRMKNEE
jgi:ATP-dependent DNA helicase RecG